MYIALDLGDTTGWAVLNEDKIIRSGHSKVGNRKFPALRFPNFLKLLDDLKNMGGEKIKKIYYESVYMPHRSIAASYAYGGYKACLEVWGDRNVIPLCPVACSSARMVVFGNGKIAKDEVFEKVKELYPTVSDHNQADAITIGLWAIKMLGNQK